jgi:ADP-ribose pyrophosphatase
MKFTTIASETIYEGKVFDLRQDRVRMPNGNEATLDIIQHPPAVTLIPVDEEGNILFVRQYRHAAGVELLELPAGVMEEGESPEACAGREMREETGMSAGSLQPIGEFHQVPGYSTEYMYIYLARELKPAPLPGDEDEFISVERYSIERAYEMATHGEIVDAKTLASLLLAIPYLRYSPQ